MALVVMAMVISMAGQSSAKAADHLTMRVSPASGSAGLYPVMKSIDPCPAGPTGSTISVTFTAAAAIDRPWDVPNVNSAIGDAVVGNDGTWQAVFVPALPSGDNEIRATCHYTTLGAAVPDVQYDPVTYTVNAEAPTLRVSSTEVPFHGSVTVTPSAPCPEADQNVFLMLTQANLVRSSYNFHSGPLKTWIGAIGGAGDLAIPPGTYDVRALCFKGYGEVADQAWLDYDPTSITLLPDPNAATPVPTGPMHVLVMGDSYSAGNGASSKYFGPSGCYRSHENYAEQFARQLRPALDFKSKTPDFRNVACSGATSIDFFEPQPGRGAGSVRAQLRAITGDEDLIFLTIGGNDARFSDIVTQCLVKVSREAGRCAAYLARADRILSGGLKRADGTTETLRASVRGVLEGVAARNSHAKIVLLGYPYLERDPGFKFGGVAVGRQLRDLISRADSQYRSITDELGPRFVYTSTLTTLGRHAPVDGTWRNDVWFVQPKTSVSIATYYHPSPRGWRSETDLLWKDKRIPTMR